MSAIKTLITIVVSLAICCVHAQNMLTPANGIVDQKWLVPRHYQVAWYLVKDSSRFEIGSTDTDITINGSLLSIVTSIHTKQQSLPWTDSTICRVNDLSPVYHSSCNAQRDMTLQFGPVVKGFYYDRINNTQTIINDTTSQIYFDSNLYPVLIGWLPLQEDYKTTIPIYDFKPGSRKGVLQATVHDVKRGKFTTRKSGVRDVWIVKVSDEISDNSDLNTYFIDIADRRTWKQQIETSGRKMEMELIEN